MLIAGGGKGECMKLQKVLAPALQTFSQKMKATALLDRDLRAGPAPEGVAYLPVSMVENFLLDPDALWDALQSVIEKTPFKSADDISAALDTLLDELTEGEVLRRTIRALGIAVFRPSPPSESIAEQLTTFKTALDVQFGAENVGTCREAAQKLLATLKESAQRREHFDGKVVLQEFRKKHLQNTGMPAGIFALVTPPTRICSFCTTISFPASEMTGSPSGLLSRSALRPSVRGSGSHIVPR